MKLTEVTSILGWYSDSVNGVEKEVKEARKQVKEWREGAEKWDLISKDLEVEEAKNTLIVEQVKKLLGNTTKNPEHCCQAFEYIRDTLQKIVREKE